MTDDVFYLPLFGFPFRWWGGGVDVVEVESWRRVVGGDFVDVSIDDFELGRNDGGEMW